MKNDDEMDEEANKWSGRIKRNSLHCRTRFGGHVQAGCLLQH